MSYEYWSQRLRDHHYDRQSLDLLHAAMATSVCPPAGHAYIGLLSDAATYFQEELPRHIVDEELHVFEHYAGREGSHELRPLREEHRSLTVLAAGFGSLARTFLAAPSDDHWRHVRLCGLELEAAMRRHLAHEEDVLRRLSRSSAEEPT